MTGVKTQDMKLVDQVAGCEIARHENAGSENGRHVVIIFMRLTNCCYNYT